MKNNILASVFLSAAVWATPSLAFDYHDNDVYVPVSSSAGYNMTGGSFTVTGLSIPDGQDPDGYNYVGMVLDFDSSGKMTFKVGRHSSSDVADWFTDRISADENTFNKDPGDLNFAFMGDLEVTYSGGTLAPYSQTFTFEDVMIAQGNDAWVSNNWWYGGQNCSYTSGNSVDCDGTSPTGWPVTSTFLRGGNSKDYVDTTDIYVQPFATTNLSSNYVGESSSCAWQPSTQCPPYVTYYTQSQANTILLSVYKNKLINALGNNFDTNGADISHSGRAAIFVMDTSGRIYASNQNKVYMFHHSSILAGKPVAAAGELMVTSGQISAMSNCSGHYLPSNNLTAQFRESLSRQGYTGTYSNIVCSSAKLVIDLEYNRVR